MQTFDSPLILRPKQEGEISTEDMKKLFSALETCKNLIGYIDLDHTLYNWGKAIWTEIDRWGLDQSHFASEPINTPLNLFTSDALLRIKEKCKNAKLIIVTSRHDRNNFTSHFLEEIKVTEKKIKTLELKPDYEDKEKELEELKEKLEIYRKLAIAFSVPEKRKDSYATVATELEKYNGVKIGMSGYTNGKLKATHITKKCLVAFQERQTVLLLVDDKPQELEAMRQFFLVNKLSTRNYKLITVLVHSDGDFSNTMYQDVFKHIENIFCNEDKLSEVDNNNFGNNFKAFLSCSWLCNCNCRKGTKQSSRITPAQEKPSHPITRKPTEQLLAWPSL